MIRYFISLFAILSFTVYTGEITVDMLPASGGNIKVHFIKHATLVIEHGALVIHVDPAQQYTDYKKQPKADIVLVTHEHGDHCDANALALIMKKDTAVIGNAGAVAKLKTGQALSNGQSLAVKGITIRAVPAYNTTPGRSIFHPKGRDNGYVLTIGGTHIYIGGDTEDIPEMKDLKDIEIAFLPMNQPYTMTIPQAVNAMRMIRPKITYPYHYGNTDIRKFQEAAKSETYTEVRIREMQ
ncbi:MAG: MBL fold metallo-hydrolase [Spirochaetota bacterium]